MVKSKFFKIIIILFIIISIIIVFIFKSFKESDFSNIEDKKDKNTNNVMIIKMINFTSKGCMPCEQMKVLIKELKEEYKDKVEINEIDVYENLELCNKYNIVYTPTQVFLDESGNVVKSHVGFLGKYKIKEILDAK